MNHRSRITSILAGLLIWACGDAGEYVYGDTLEQVELTTNDQSIGVYPSTTVMDDPNNPFRLNRPGTETKWDIESARNPIAGFYSWATWLATEPVGEYQFYVGLNLKSIYDRQLVDPGQLEFVRTWAIEAFRAVLDYFPDAVTYDITGTVAYPLAIQAYGYLVDLGGDPSPWRVVISEMGEEVLIR